MDNLHCLSAGVELLPGALRVGAIVRDMLWTAVSISSVILKVSAIASSLVMSLLLAGCSAFPASYEAKLADHLTKTGAKMYGAYWCPHCARQKRKFGGAARRLPYVECDQQGINAKPEACAAVGVEVYPTWVIEGEHYLGTQPLGRLSALSGFESPEGVPLPEDSEPAGGYSSVE